MAIIIWKLMHLGTPMYTHPKLLGTEHSLCFLSPHLFSVFLMLVALVVTLALFGFLNSRNM